MVQRCPVALNITMDAAFTVTVSKICLQLLAWPLFGNTFGTYLVSRFYGFFRVQNAYTFRIIILIITTAPKVTALFSKIVVLLLAINVDIFRPWEYLETQVGYY